jgi:DNA-binding MarR family transcriptional regulator
MTAAKQQAHRANRGDGGDATEAQVQDAMGGLGHLSRRLNQAHARLWQRGVSAEVTGPQYTVLGLLRRQDHLDQKSLGAQVHLDKSTLAPLLERLRSRGLIRIEVDPADRRRKLLRITPDGVALVERLAPAAVALNRRLLGALTATAAARLSDDLDRIVCAAEQRVVHAPGTSLLPAEEAADRLDAGQPG